MTDQELFILGKQLVPFKEIHNISDIMNLDLNSSPVFNASLVYQYGFIQGKRAERRRRKTSGEMSGIDAKQCLKDIIVRLPEENVEKLLKFIENLKSIEEDGGKNDGY